MAAPKKGKLLIPRGGKGIPSGGGHIEKAGETGEKVGPELVIFSLEGSDRWPGRFGA